MQKQKEKVAVENRMWKFNWLKNYHLTLLCAVTPGIYMH
jgi:hypothetical protein